MYAISYQLKTGCKPQYSNRKKKGFTLVELAIVLVVIGLLVGGILSAQSLIQTAKISAQAAQIGQFDAGVANFKQKYNYLPGDAPAFGGDGNGFVTGYGTSGMGDRISLGVFNCDVANFWNNVFPEEYEVPAVVCPSIPLSTAIDWEGSAKNVIKAKIGNKNSFFIASAANHNSTDGYAAIYNEHFYIMMTPNYIEGTGMYKSRSNASRGDEALKPSELAALDKKIDDQMPQTGNVVSGVFLHVTMAPAIPVSDDNINYTDCMLWTGSSYIYNIAVNDYRCTPFFRIGLQTGELQ